MSQDGLYYWDDNQPITGTRLIRVSPSSPLPVTSSGGGGGGNVNINQVGGAPIALGQTTSPSSFPVTIASDQSLSISGTVVASGTVSLGAGSAAIGTVTLGAGAATIGALTANQSVNVAQINGVTTTMGNGVSGTGVQRVTIASDSTGVISLVPVTSGGVSTTSNIMLNGTTAIVVKASAGQLYGFQIFNNASTSIAYLKVYDATSATAGSGTPKLRFMVPAPAVGGGGVVYNFPVGIAFTTGITYIMTTGIADADTTAPAATTYIVNVFYK